MAGSITVISTSAATQDVVSTTTETSIFAPTVPANTLGTANFCQCLILGDILGNAAGNLTLRIKFGGTTYYNDLWTIVTSATRRPFFARIILAGRNATNAQTLSGVLLLGTAGGATTGLGNLDVDEIETTAPIFNGALAIDQTSNQTFDVTVDWDTSSASKSFRRHFASLVAFKV